MATGNGNGEGNGGGFKYYRSGPIDVKPVITSIIDVPKRSRWKNLITFKRCKLDVNSHPDIISIS